MAGSKSFDFVSTYTMEKTILRGTGIFPAPTERPTILYVKRTMIIIIQIMMIAFMANFVLENFKDPIKITETLFVCLTVCSSLIKMINLVLNKKFFVLLENYFSNYIIKDTITKNLTMIKRDIGKTQKIMAVYKFVVIQTILTYFTKPLFVLNKEYRMPIASYFPWNVEISTNFFLTYILQLVQITTSASLHMSIDVCFAIFSTIVSTEFRVLKNNLMNMDYSSLNRNVRIEMRENVMLHKEILKKVNALENLFKYSILGQFLVSIIVICFTGFQIVSYDYYDKSTDAFGKISHLYACFSYLSCMLLQVSIYCIWGQDIMAESSDINQAIYLSNWYNADISIRRDLLILRESVKTPVLLKAGKVVPLTLETFVEILRSSYSFLAVLLQIN